VLKNKIYFSFVNNHGHATKTEVIADALKFVKDQRADLEFHVERGRLHSSDLEIFDAETEKAWSVGLLRGLSGQRRTQAPSFFGKGEPFLSFPTIRSEGERKTFVLLSQSYLPDIRGGNARHTHDIARAIGDLGHTVHVLTRGEENN